MRVGLKIAFGIGGLLIFAKRANTRQLASNDGGGGRLEDIADAIQNMEGYFPGSLAYQNNNPGNLRYVGAVAFGGVDTSLGVSGFSKFRSYADGRRALLWQIRNYAARGVTFRQFLAAYAPASDNNDPINYSNFVADWIGADPDDLLSDWI